jgi:hypothetical protein
MLALSRQTLDYTAGEYIAKVSANQKDDLGFAIETLEDPPLLVGRVHQTREIGG